jgi:hypothetical protein
MTYLQVSGRYAAFNAVLGQARAQDFQTVPDARREGVP